MNKIKFIVAVIGITLATFGSIKQVHARERVWCVAGGQCGTTASGQNIVGSVSHNPPPGN